MTPQLLHQRMQGQLPPLSLEGICGSWDSGHLGGLLLNPLQFLRDLSELRGYYFRCISPVSNIGGTNFSHPAGQASNKHILNP